jgi:hypothetical protein
MRTSSWPPTRPSSELRGKTVVVLDIPDDYGFMDSDLVERLEAAVVPALDRLTGQWCRRATARTCRQVA